MGNTIDLKDFKLQNFLEPTIHSVSFSQILVDDDDEGDLLMTHFGATIFSS